MTDFSPQGGASSEWWYFSGRLTDNKGQQHRYMLALIRSARAGIEIGRFAHFTICLLQLQVGVACERAVSPFGNRLSVRPRSLDYDGWTLSCEGATFVVRANYQAHELQLNLTAGSSFLPGHNGKIDIGRIHTECCSMPRLATSGEIRIGQEISPVTGTSWCDHEWGTVGFPHRWDWLAVNFESGDDLVVRLVGDQGIANLRHTDGKTDTTSAIQATPLRHWRNDRGALYPVDWRIELPEFCMQLEVTAEEDGCEVPFPLRYWEGHCYVRARSRGDIVHGQGYMELVGYDPGTIQFIRSRLIQHGRDLLFRNQPAIDVGGSFPQR